MNAMKFVAAAALAFTAATAPVAPAGASRTDNDGANAGVHDFCTALVASGTFEDMNYGECVGFWRASPQGFIAKYCDMLLETGTLEDEFDSYSDCIRNAEL